MSAPYSQEAKAWWKENAYKFGQADYDFDRYEEVVIAAWEAACSSDELRSALRALVSCVERDRGGGGILLPTEAALSRAKEVLAGASPDGPNSTATPVAWMSKQGFCVSAFMKAEGDAEYQSRYCIPLYERPEAGPGSAK